jgi:hypothetical protein
MYAQAQSGFEYRIPVGAVFVPDQHGTAYGARPGPLLYALSTLDRGINQPTGHGCVTILARSQQLPTACRALFLADLRTRGIDAVIVSDIGAPATVARYKHFFASLLGQPRAVPDASVFVGIGSSPHRLRRPNGRPRSSRAPWPPAPTGPS